MVAGLLGQLYGNLWDMITVAVSKGIIDRKHYQRAGSEAENKFIKINTNTINKTIPHVS